MEVCGVGRKRGMRRSRRDGEGKGCRMKGEKEGWKKRRRRRNKTEK